jgi:hypothetical protein
MKNRIVNIIIKVIISFIIIYSVFIIEEIIRLSKSLQEPLILFEEVNTVDGVTYKSLGYTLNRNYHCISNDLCIVNEVEFLLFDKYFIWGWIS